LPIWARAAWPEVERFLREEKLRVLAAVPRAATSLYDVAWDEPTAVLLGAEGKGLESEVAACADLGISIPMRPGIESLNVATTAALVAYEARRFREGVPRNEPPRTKR
jgi:TrmH family RNA methyltransferase